MQFFDKYFSNTVAATNNQKFFLSDGQTHVCRTCVPLSAGGTYGYAFLFANMVASTFNDGSESRCNRLTDEWEIRSFRVGVCPEGWDPAKVYTGALSAVTFDGKENRLVHPGEIFASDPIALSACAGQLLCMEIAFCGKEIPYLCETLSSSFEEKNGAWVPCDLLPHPVLIGCDRPVKNRVVFLGDSITEGIGTPKDSYAGYAAVTARLCGDTNGYWDIGLGYGRGADAASEGLWLFEAKQGDVVSVCFGVNDILQGGTEEKCKADLLHILRRLKEAGCRVLMQTVPPFDMDEKKENIRLSVNRYILDELSGEADAVFDNGRILSDPANAAHAVWGGHPDVTGCRLWGEALAETLREIL